jgi:hypothetical protein
MTAVIKNPWPDRDHYVQSLYISPCIQDEMPNTVVGDEAISAEVEEYIREQDRPHLEVMLGAFLRGASTRFFNLPTARLAIEKALRAEYYSIETWLRDARSARYAFDYFGGDDDLIVGYGILESAPATIRYTKNIRLVLQRMPNDTYVLWTAYPLLAPREPCWVDVYDFASHAPTTSLSQVLYYFLNCYLSVTPIYVGMDAVIHGTTDFWLYESKDEFEELQQTIKKLRYNNMHADDQSHLTYELSIRCLDETLPEHYISRPAVLVEALGLSLARLAKAKRSAD